MKKVLFVLTFAILAMGCTATIHVEPINEPTWTLFYDWGLPGDDSNSCINGVSCKEKQWNPMLAGNEGIYRNIPLAAGLAGFPVGEDLAIEKFSKGDLDRIPYIILVYTKEGIRMNTVTFVINTVANGKRVFEKIDVTKSPMEDWLSFYTRGFEELRALIPTTTKKKSPPPEDTADTDTDTNDTDAGPSDSSTANNQFNSEQNIAELIRLINEYRVSKKLPAIARSASLEKVAQAHVQDLETNHPNKEPCNMHSWSDKDKWTACCYTPDQKQAKCMWDKPKEIANFNGKGYEIAYGTTGALPTPQSAIEGWKKSPLHNDTIINRGTFKDAKWQSLGVAFSEHYAVAWFAEEADKPAGTESGPAVSTASDENDTLLDAIKAEAEKAPLAKLKDAAKKMSASGYHRTIDQMGKKKVIAQIVSWIGEHLQSKDTATPTAVLHFLQGEKLTDSDKKAFAAYENL